MENIKKFNDFLIVNESTLFGDSSKDKQKILINHAKSKDWKTEKRIGTSAHSVPKEVRHLWPKSAQDSEKGEYKIDTVTIWCNESPKELMQEIIEVLGLKKKPWYSSGIKSVAHYSGKKTDGKAVTFVHDVIGAISIEVKKIESRINTSNTIAFVHFLKEEKQIGSGNVNQDAMKTIDSIFSSLPKEQQSSIIYLLKDKYSL